MCTHRRVTPALGARFLRSYVPLRYDPSESGCGNNTYLPADTSDPDEDEYKNLSSSVSVFSTGHMLSCIHNHKGGT